MRTEHEKELRYLKSVLESKNLEQLITLSTIFSGTDYFQDEKSKFLENRTLVHHMNSMIFTKVLFSIKANYFKKEPISGEDFPKIINTCNELLSRSSYFDDPNLTDIEKTQKFLGYMQSSQMWFRKERPQDKTGLLYALYKEIPEKYNLDLKDLYKDNFIHIPTIITKEIGIGIENYFIISIYLGFIHYKEIFKKHILPSKHEKNILEKFPNRSEERFIYNRDLIIDRITKLPYYYNILTFSKEFLKKRFQFLSSEEIENYLKLTSNTFFKLRELDSSKPYQLGHISEKLSPLERYPILKLDFPVYIVPSFHFFNLGYNSLLKWKLQEIYRDNRFNNILGRCYELLVLELLKQKRDEITIIEERVYKNNGTDYRGPDFIIQEGKNLILIEVKSKNILLNTRIEHYSESLLNDLDTLINALYKLEKEKLTHIKERKDIYGDIDYQKVERVILLGIIGEGVLSMQEFIMQLKVKNEDSLLNQLTLPHIFMDIYTFFKCIEISKYNDETLVDLLMEYWNRGNKKDFEDHTADQFNSKEYAYSNSFASKRIDSIISNIKRQKSTN